MIPLHTRSPSYSRSALESDWHTRMRRFVKRHSKNKGTIIALGIVMTILLYLLWPSSHARGSFDRWLPPSERNTPSYTNLPPERRAEAVKEAFGHAYSAYEKHALPADELRPLTNTSQQNFNGWGVSIYDGLDTLWLMGMKPEFERAISHISKATFYQPSTQHAMFFETVIRYLGGLLSSYALTGRSVLLTKADELGAKLLPAFQQPIGMPVFAVNAETGEVHPGPRRGQVIIAEIASCQMEYKYLAHLTGKPEYFHAADKIMTLLEEQQLENGMWNTLWNGTTGEQIDHHLTIGAWADSAYEYLLKQYLMSGRTEKRLRDMYIKSATGAINSLIYLSPTRNILYITDTYKGVPTHTFEHLSCFFPGLLALGVQALAEEMDPATLELHTWAAQGLAQGCWLMYADQASGLAPEEVVMLRQRAPHLENATRDAEMEMRDGLWVDVIQRWREAEPVGGKPPGVGTMPEPKPYAPPEDKDYRVRNPKYLLRPETIESLYVMWRTTGDEVWRERGWRIFLAIEALCRTRSAYASVRGVDRAVGESVVWMDEMPSYALAETWKYLYLMFLDHDPLPADKYVFNTEAHPFPIFEWDEREKEAYGIR